MEQMTVKQALELTIANLERIKVPMGEMQEVGLPLAQNIGNLKEILTAINRAEQQEKEEKDAKVTQEIIERVERVEREAKKPEVVT